MGMESRRYGIPTSGGAWGITRAVKLLLIANCAVFLAQNVIAVAWPPAFRLIIEWFGLVPYAVIFRGRIWQPFTYLFLHFDIWHILINMFVLWMFGRDLEQVWGFRRFLNYYFTTGVGAALCVVGIKFLASVAGISRSDVPTIGASGAIYGILIACAILFPERRIWMFPFPGLIVTMRVFVLIWGAIEFFGTLRPAGDGVSHVAHLSGMLVGWLYLRRGSLFFGLRNRVSDWQRRRLRRKFEVYMRDHHDEPPPRPDHWVN